MASLRAKLVAKAKELFDANAPEGAIAVLSPTPEDLIERVLNYLLDSYGEKIRGKTVIDIGCGDGRWIVRWVTKMPKCIAYGTDLDEGRLILAHERACKEGVRDRIELVGDHLRLSLLNLDCKRLSISSAVVDTEYASVKWGDRCNSFYGQDFDKSQVEVWCSKDPHFDRQPLFGRNLSDRAENLQRQRQNTSYTLRLYVKQKLSSCMFVGVHKYGVSRTEELKRMTWLAVYLKSVE